MYSSEQIERKQEVLVRGARRRGWWVVHAPVGDGFVTRNNLSVYLPRHAWAIAPCHLEVSSLCFILEVVSTNSTHLPAT